MAATTTYDIIVFGATSFVGQITCRYLATLNEPVNWAIAGRSADKLAAVQQELGLSNDQLPAIVVDASDESGLRAMVDQTSVVISTVGPYALYGETLVRVCATSGTDYCDLTGEAQWADAMIKQYEADASKSGARILHCSGFDSIPSDLGVWYFQQQYQQDTGQPCTDVTMAVKVAKGGMSGGTVASILNVVDEAKSNPDLRRKLNDPYLLCGPEHQYQERQTNQMGAAYNDIFQRWTAPFIMAAINTKVVHRSNLLLNSAYGTNFRYQETMMTGSGFSGRMAAVGLSFGMGLFMVSAALAPTKYLLQKFVVPAPGEGPSPQAQIDGFYDLRFAGHKPDGSIFQTKVTGDQDPGYGSTAKMLAQVALCLAHDSIDVSGGFWTPASALGAKLQQRLQQFAGLTFEVIAN